MHFALNQNVAKLILFELLLSKSVALLQKYLKKGKADKHPTETSNLVTRKGFYGHPEV